jgi:hypothetical protein
VPALPQASETHWTCEQCTFGGNKMAEHEYCDICHQGTRPAAQQQPMAMGAASAPSGHALPGYLFHCSSATEQECFHRMLFGAPQREWGKIQLVGLDTLLFMFNVNTKMMHGVFRAAQPPAQNIVPGAWAPRGNFPSQVVVKAHEGFVRGIFPKGNFTTKCGPMSEAEVMQLKAIFMA